MQRSSWALRLGLLLLLSAEATAAQQEPRPADLPGAPAPKPDPAHPKRNNPLKATFEILGRRSVFFPDLAASPGPLTTRQKLELFADKSFAPSRFLSSGLSAGVSQARDTLPAYGQGMGGYGKRFGSSMASGASTEFFGTFLFASLLHRDPRYFVTLHGSPWRRIGYSVSRLVVTRTDAGSEGLNWPGIVGPLAAESLANSYLPVAEQTASRTFRRYGIRLGFTATANIVKEYWPTIFRDLRISKIAPGLGPGLPPPGPPPRGAPRFLP